MEAESRASNLRKLQKQKKAKYKENKKKFRKGKKKSGKKKAGDEVDNAAIPEEAEEEIDPAKEQREIVKQVMTDFSARQKKVKMERMRVKLHKEQMEAASRIQAMYRGFGTRRDEGLIKSDYRQLGIDMAKERKRRERGGLTPKEKRNRGEIYDRLAKSTNPQRKRTISEGGADRRYQVALLPKLPQSIQDRANRLRRFHTSEDPTDLNGTTGTWSGSLGSGAINFSKDELLAIRKAFEGMSLKTSPRRKLLPKLQQQKGIPSGKNPTTISKYLQSPDNRRAQKGIKAKAKATLKKIKRPEWDSSISNTSEFGHTPFSKSRPGSLLSTL